MKTQIQTKNQGGALVMTLLTALVIGVALASYLTLVSSQNKSTMRSLAWNSSVPVLEAGVEAALTHLHYKGLTNLNSEGWSWMVGGVYGKRGFLDNNVYYEVTIEPVDPPVIIAMGHVPAPVTSSSQMGMILGAVFPPLPNQPATLKRKVRVTTRRDALYAKAMVAKGQINMNGNNIATDSFDSGDPLYNTNGSYDAAKSKDNGDVATNSGLVNSLSVGNADIKGHVATGPGGSVSVGSNGTVGNAAWVNGGNQGIQPGYLSDDMNMDIPDVQVPFTSGYSTPGGGTVGGVSYTYLMGGNQNYQLSSVSLSGQNRILIASGNVVLYVTGNFSMSGQSYIQIKPGASLKLYVGGSSASLGGQGVMNETGNAAKFSYYGLPGNTSLSMSGNAAFTGTIYAPNADFSLGGGGNNNYDFVGSSITKTVTMNGHFKFHYDENLRRVGPGKDFVVTSWNEIDPNQ